MYAGTVIRGRYISHIALSLNRVSSSDIFTFLTNNAPIKSETYHLWLKFYIHAIFISKPCSCNVRDCLTPDGYFAVMRTGSAPIPAIALCSVPAFGSSSGSRDCLIALWGTVSIAA